MLMPAPIDAARPTLNVSAVLPVANAAAKSGASVETDPSIRPARPGCTNRSTNNRRPAVLFDVDFAGRSLLAVD